MADRLAFQTLIELFNKSLARTELARKQYLEVVRTEREEHLTFEQLKAAAQDFALWLIQARGIRIKDKIAMLGKNRADWDVALWGIILAGAVPVLIDPERPPEAVQKHLTSTDARLIVMADDYHDTDARQQLREFASSRGLGLIEMTGNAAHKKNGLNSIETSRLLNKISAQVKADDTAVIVSTSGTTDDPREVELTHTNLIANIQGALETVKITSDDKFGHVVPPHHSFGFTATKLLPLWVGATNIYTNKYRQISKIIRDKNITIFIGIPALFTVLAKKLEETLAEQKEKRLLLRLIDRCLPKLVGKRIVKTQGWQNLRFFLSGAAPVPRWTLGVFWKRGLQLREGYGTTENSPIYGFNDNHRRLGSVGKPIPTLLVKIVGEKNQTLRVGEKGEIVLGGPCIMKGYYKNPKATRAVIKTDDKGVRWLHTGDLGYLDKDGYLFITGRKKYVIVLPGGKNVNPELVELVLSQAQYVKEVLVVPGLQGRDFAGSQTHKKPLRVSAKQAQDKSRQRDTAPIEQEAVRAIVQPAWDVIESDTKLSYADLVRQPQVLKSLIWQNINECQQKSQWLSGFEKVSPHRLEIRIDEFEKTSTGKIKRDLYIKMGR